MRKRTLHWPAIAAAAIGLGVVSWILLMNGRSADYQDRVNPILIPQESSSAGVSTVEENVQAAPNIMPKSPLFPTASTMPGNQMDQPQVALQQRDPEWADKTESDIEGALRNIPSLATSTPLDVKCGTTVCEARGKLRTDASTYNRDQAAKYLRDGEFVDALGRANALTDKVVLDQDTGHFTIYFSRVRK